MSDLHGGASHTARLAGYAMGLPADTKVNDWIELREALLSHGIDYKAIDIRFVGVSDKFDRGPKPIETAELIEFLRDGLNKAKPIMGNHDLWRALGVLGVHELDFSDESVFGEPEIIKGDHPAHWAKESFWHSGWGDVELIQVNQKNINGIIEQVNEDIISYNSNSGSELPLIKTIDLESKRNEFIPELKRLKEEKAKIRKENERLRAEGQPEISDSIELPDTFEVVLKYLEDEVNSRNEIIRSLNEGNDTNFELIEYKPVDRSNYRRNKGVVKRALWDLKSLRLIYIDIYGNVYLHGIIPFNEKSQEIDVSYKGFNGFRALELLQWDIRSFFEKFKGLPDNDEFRRFMWKEVGEALTIINSWYSDIKATAKPISLQNFIRRGGPKGFGFGNESRNMLSDRRATGMLVLGHNERKKLRTENVPWFDAELFGGMMNIDFELSDGYANMGSIMTIGLRDENGDITGIRRYGYADGEESTPITDLTLNDLEGATSEQLNEIEKLMNGRYFMNKYKEKAEKIVLANIEQMIIQAYAEDKYDKVEDLRILARKYRAKIRLRRKEKIDRYGELPEEKALSDPSGSAPRNTTEMEKRYRHLKVTLANFLKENPERTFLFAYDTDIAETQSSDVSMLGKVISQLDLMLDKEGRKLFPGLVCVRGSGSGERGPSLAARIEEKRKSSDGANIKNEDIFILSNMRNNNNDIFDDYTSRGAWITLIDDSSIGEGDYVPIPESVLLMFAGALGVDDSRILYLMKNISSGVLNSKNVQDMIDQRLFVVIPKAARYDKKELKEIYELVTEFYTSA